VRITNCHLHTFTHEHTPDRYVPWPLNRLVKVGWIRQPLIWLAEKLDPERHSQLARYAQIVDVSFHAKQAEIFDIVRGFYPADTRFVILPMDMTFMGCGAVPVSIDTQHEELATIRRANEGAVIPFAAVDPRHDDIVERTRQRLDHGGFEGLKLYPALGYHPCDKRLRPLYAYAEANGFPVMAHCSHRGSNYRGEITEEMRLDPTNDERHSGDRQAILDWYTAPDSYLPLLKDFPNLRICLAHWGGDEEWTRYVGAQRDADREGNWAARIFELIASGDHPNLWTDISYTLFADDEFVYLLKIFLADERVRTRVLFGSDFYVVDNAQLEERRRSVRIRAVLGEDLFRTIAEENPGHYLRES
jgi:predicted TIM-barrel fold metal-dependent hydrolase